MSKKLSLFLIVILFLIAFLVMGLSYFTRWHDNQSKATVELTSKGRQMAGDIIEVDINIDSKESTINAAEAYLRFDPEYLEVQSVEKTGSFFEIWINNEPKFSNTNGTISFAGGLPTPGFKGKGRIGMLKLKLKKPGNSQIIFEGKSRLLLDDNNGTSIPLRMDSINITIK